MCSEFFHNQERRARKEHRCEDCRRVIQPGDRYYRFFGISDAQPFAGSRCRRCDLVSQVAFDEAGDDACYTAPREILREVAKDYGWRSLLAAFRRVRDLRTGTPAGA